MIYAFNFLQTACHCVIRDHRCGLRGKNRKITGFAADTAKLGCLKVMRIIALLE